MNSLDFTTEDIHLFWEKVNIPDDPDACWEWQAGKSQGYGTYYVRALKTMIGAHRIMWILINGEIPKGLEICHGCDHPPCCNPNHLFLGTHLENMRDAMNKKRLYTVPKNTIHGSAKNQGDKNPKAKLTWENVREIRRLWQEGNVTQNGLARQFGVSRDRISAILLNKAWIE